MWWFGKIKTMMKSDVKILQYSFNNLLVRVQQIVHKLRHFIHTIRDLRFGDSSIFVNSLQYFDKTWDLE